MSFYQWCPDSDIVKKVCSKPKKDLEKIVNNTKIKVPDGWNINSYSIDIFNKQYATGSISISFLYEENNDIYKISSTVFDVSGKYCIESPSVNFEDETEAINYVLGLMGRYDYELNLKLDEPKKIKPKDKKPKDTKPKGDDDGKKKK